MQDNSAYAILGVSKGITEKDLRNVYVQLVKKYDPEKHTERFMVIQKAYDKLKNPKTRVKEDVFAFNMPLGEFLFQPDEKLASGEEVPHEGAVTAARANYHENPGEESARTGLRSLLFKRSHHHAQHKQHAEALRDWEEILEIEPTNVRARLNLELGSMMLGVSYAMHGLNEDAIELWDRALKLNPDNTDLVQNLALVSEKAGLPARAIAFWMTVIERWKLHLAKEPDNDYLRLLIVEALNHQAEYADEHPQAANEANAIRESLSPTAAPKHNGPISTYNNQPREAPPSPPQPIKPPAEPPTAVGSGTVRVSASDPAPSSTSVPKSGTWNRMTVPKVNVAKDIVRPTSSASLDRYRDIVRLNPNDFETHFQFCNKLMEERLWEEALKELEDLARKHPRNVEVLNLMGWALLNSRQKEKAFAAWKRSMSIDPKNPSTREQLVRANLLMGKSYREKGLFTPALVHFKQLLALMPGSSEVHLEIAATYDMKGDRRSAEMEYNEVMKLDPKNATAKKAIADLRMKR